MAEETTAPVEGAQDTGVAATQGDTSVEETVRPALGDAGGGDTGDTKAPAGWPEDWRERMAAGDEKELARLKRFANLENLHKSYRQLEKKLASGQTAEVLAEDATPEEIAVYHQARGIPETPDGYDITFPEEANPTEAANAALAAFKADMHAAHIPPEVAKKAFDSYLKQAQAEAVARAEAIQEANLNAVAELRAAFPGKQFKNEMKLTEDWLAPHFDGNEKALDAVLETVMPNGVKVKNYPPFVKTLAQMARTYADEDAVVAGDAAGSGKGLEEQIADLRAKSVTGKISKAEDERLNKLYEMRLGREARGGKQAA